MTTLGKILVIVNLVFSLVVGGLIVTVYTTRTNWKAAYDKLEQRYKVATASTDTYAQEVERVKTVFEARIKVVESELDKVKKDRDAIQGTIAEKNRQIKAAEDKNKAFTTNVGATTAELDRRKVEVQHLQSQVDARDRTVLALEVKVQQLRDQAVQADIAAKSAQGRNERLLAQQQELSKELERVKSSRNGAAGAIPKRPPPEDVEGVVLESDPKTGLVTISLGSDHGIANGHTLEVFRLKPEPKYLGTLRILDTHHREAVARPVVPNRNGAIQKGDRVASSILGQR